MERVLAETVDNNWIDGAVDPLISKEKDNEWIKGAVDPLTIDHVPESIKNTRFENKETTLENIPYGKGATGFDLGVEVDEGLLPFSLKAYKGLAPEEASR